MGKIVIAVIGTTLAWIAARVIGPPFMEIWGEGLKADVKEVLFGARDAPWGEGWAWALGSFSLALALAAAVTAWSAAAQMLRRRGTIRSFERRAVIACAIAAAFVIVKPRFGVSETYETIGRAALYAAAAGWIVLIASTAAYYAGRFIERRREDREFAREYEEHYGKPLSASYGGPTKWLWSDGRFHAFPEPEPQAEPEAERA